MDNDRELALAYEWGQIQMQRTVLARMTQADPANSFIVQEFEKAGWTWGGRWKDRQDYQHFEKQAR